MCEGDWGAKKPALFAAWFTFFWVENFGLQRLLV